MDRSPLAPDGPPEAASGLPRSPGVGSGQGPDTHLEELLRRLQEHRPGKTRYQVVGQVARGGMGVVLEVWDSDLRRRLAMKSLHRRASVDPERDGDDARDQDQRFLTRFLEEAQITGQLGHPGVVPLYELGLDGDGRPYFTMPLVRGRTLADIVDEYHSGEGEWTLVRLVGVLLKVCEAVAFAHAKGVIHRDLKPSNVMVGRFGEVYVMDWGLARVVGEPDAHDIRLRREEKGGGASSVLRVRTDRSDAKQARGDSPLLTMDGDVIGTPAYMPPEQAEGRIDELGPRSDVYSLGGLLYTVLTGRDPYSTDEGRLSAHAVLRLLLQGPPHPASELQPAAPPGLVSICEKAMRREPAGRYATALELAEDLLAFLELRAPAAHEAGLVELASLWWARHRAVATTAAAAAGFLLAASVLFVLGLSSAYEDEKAAREESVLRGDALGVQALLVEEVELWPAVPGTVPRMEAWIAEARVVLERAPAHRASLTAAPEGGLIERSFAGVERLEELVPRVEERLARAQDLEQRTLVDAKEGWEGAIRSIAASETYGFDLAPQLGLIPLRENPATGLWEFWHVASGQRPELSKEGRWRIDESSGMVLVLLPGGEFDMGTPVGSPYGGYKEDLHRTSVGPFLLSAFETTQAQWERVMGDNPSHYRPGDSVTLAITGVHPVESVSWHDAERFAWRIDLRLPRETEWEYACRAGSTTQFPEGDEVASLRGHANALDQSASRTHVLTKADWEDGFSLHAPSGSFRSSAFGLYDMLGNVAEWCADSFWLYPSTKQADAEERERGAEVGWRARLKIYRGGGWSSPLSQLTCAFRYWALPTSAVPAIGTRMARDVRP